MAARKLQTEIERTLKKVAEGVEIFEGIFEKIQTSTNQTQKEKLEVDLKSQIKKLQRLRDQIKTWMQSNDIKDKQPLMDNRKLIETQMERFKACEKEMKTKAFSKEGLSAAAKLDPKEQAKAELCQWITTMVDELSRQVEQAEAEVETLQLLKKKKDSDREQRLEVLEHLNERRSWHVNRLELILRLLENGNLQTESVADVKDDIGYFVESNTEEDFEEDEGIYDDLNLQEEEDMYQVGGDDFTSSHDSTSVVEEPAPIPTPAPAPPPPRTPAKDTKVVKEAAAAAAAAAAAKEEESKKASTVSKTPPAPTTTNRKPTLDSNTPRPNLSTPTRSTSGPGPVPRTVPAPLPPIRYAAAAAAANATAPTPTTTTTPTSATTAAAPPGLTSPPPPTSTTNEVSAPTVSSPEVTKAIPPPTTTTDASRVSSAAPSPLVAPSVVPSLGGQPSPAISSASINGASSNGPSAPSVSSSSQAPGGGSAGTIVSPSPSSASLPQPIGTAAGAVGDERSSSPSSKGQDTVVPRSTTAPGAGGNEPRLPSSLADLVTSFESAKQKSMRRDNDLGAIHKILDAGFSNVPQPLDAEKPKYYVPRQPYATPNYYPQEPSGQFANPALFAKLDVDTLFYVFYYCPGTYLQYLAASELKKQSWRFHKQYLTWFQRANEPQQITDEYEEGIYLYFDYEGSWCQRRKNQFRFEYRYLDTD